MTILFAGGELDGIVPSDSSVVEVTTVNPGLIDVAYSTTYSRCAIHISSSIQYADTPSWSSQGTLWFHGVVSFRSLDAAERTILSLYEGTTEVFKITSAGSTCKAYYLSAAPSTFTQVGSSFTVTQLSVQTFDVKLVAGASGAAEVYVAGTLRTSVSTAMSAFTGVTMARLRSPYYDAYWSQILCSTTSTVGRVVSTKYPTGNGANTAWTGDYTGVDEAVYSDADGITSGSADQVETFTGNTPAVNGFKVEAVAVNARAKRSETGPQNVQLALRTSATNYFSSTKALTLGFTGVGNVWETNPNTSAAWVAATAQAVEFGAKSIT